jgi:hypothetical protein
LENDKWLSSEDDFDDSSDDDFEVRLIDDYDHMAEVEEGNLNNDSHYMFVDSSTMNDVSDNSKNSLRKAPNNYVTSWLSDPADTN